MDEINNQFLSIETDYLTEQEANKFKKLLAKCMKSYKSKAAGVSDKEWLKQLFKEELPEMTENEVEADSSKIFEAINKFDTNLKSINEAAEAGVSKELWFTDTLLESAAGMRVNEYDPALKNMNNLLYQKNAELHEALIHNNSGHIKMKRKPDRNIPENIIAETTELITFFKGKNIKVEVRNFLIPSSVNFRVINIDTGKYHNYQLRFGETAEDTISLINRGNYCNQRFIVPREQVQAVRKAFPAKTVEDHIEAWGYKGKKFTEKDMKALQKLVQKDSIMPRVGYNHNETKELAMSIGKNAGVMALQIAAATIGLNIAEKVVKGEKVDSEEMVEIALETGADTGIKVITASALQIAICKEIISFIPKATPAGLIDNIAWVGIENIKILWKVAAGGLSVTKGLDQIGRVTVSVVGGLWAMAEGESIGAQLTAWIPVVGLPFSVVTGFIGGMVGYFGGSKINEAIYDKGKKVRKVAKATASSAWNSMKLKVTAACKKIISLIFS
ncbi:MAG: hypothetical protein ABRQ25_16935 [Clostridiaceae bacterium]